MRFFVPKCDTPSEAQEVWQAVRQFLASEGFVSEPRKIWKVAYKQEGRPMVLKVGDPHPDTGEEVLVILKAADASCYFVCTASSGVVQGRPHTLENIAGQTLAVEFH
jgi:hypothetical protein